MLQFLKTVRRAFGACTSCRRLGLRVRAHVRKCGNLVSTADVLSIPEPLQLSSMRAIVSRFTIESSSVSTRMFRIAVTTLDVSTCEQRSIVRMYAVSLSRSLSLPCFLFLSVSLCLSVWTCWRTFDIANDRHNLLQGLSTSKEPYA